MRELRVGSFVLVLGLVAVGCPTAESPTAKTPKDTEEAPAPADDPTDDVAAETVSPPSPPSSPPPVEAEPEKPPLQLLDLSGGVQVDEVDATVGKATDKSQPKVSGRRKPAAGRSTFEGIVEEEVGKVMTSAAQEGRQELTDEELAQLADRIERRDGGKHTRKEIAVEVLAATLKHLEKALAPLKDLGEDLKAPEEKRKALEEGK